MAERSNAHGTQAEARQAGARFYAGTVCLAHPAALRYAANARCVACTKAERQAAQQTDAYRERDAARKRARRELARSAHLADLLG